jgi:hypothetical protein
MNEEQRAALRADNRRSSGVAVTSPRPVGPVGSAMGFTRPAAPTPGSYSGPGSVTREAFTVTPPPTRQTQPNIPAPVPVVPRGRPEPLDFRDSSYNSQIAAIERALRDFETGSATRGQRYQQDFATGLDRLGFRPAPQPMMAMSAMEGEPTEGAAVGFATGPVRGSFDIEGEMDRTSAAARGTRGMRDEFAGRGTLRSSDFANSFSDFQNRLQQQLTGMETGRTRFGEDLSTELAQFQARTQEQRQSAQEAAQNRALMRQLSQMGF